ncbi:MAG: hypothetical protein NTX19_06285 [Gemmatimonadetes bacterium]|jgi:hypothetical protein|nr:hypothetical protein [Gemmatimonadota bacterium]
MGRALTIQRSVIPISDRARQLERLRSKRDHYRANDCRYWVFEEASVHGAFLEFVEADSADAIAAAHSSALDAPIDATRIYLEVELS